MVVFKLTVLYFFNDVGLNAPDCNAVDFIAVGLNVKCVNAVDHDVVSLSSVTLNTMILHTVDFNVWTSM